ncbi:type II toxin-antitoxin system Phd/YefM family antitoxin [Cronobacter sakazakii]|uniref:type II toxin-antitoxin system Phd/YefM family antitoxin n=1 Tax=Cronobacter sakazakii TaxID=28141 RepID=UPI0009B1FDA3|nr:type II toxin-antitoxin system Phd/YefM family antitoxin [Cronobacter sakazakii]KAB0851669.1 type II toxin-antitoxin system Phd/YefM family antitoxin [Cronobacter sakazakii]MDQ1936610.1 type II toxin-antitoxin system Phd/YefM family antitoxin [Cronobacter sakazakii]MDQ1942506.1 type II toxin-antitoxin system Phd/YefM family antitoxin [Cronobacter sakazakii]MDQ1946782.1 type II toxin-antitoxin system Phd/YefM family antitoxin [Cronobacter sakazakii]MDQ1949277.1 type II toxin-antitoxin system
MKIITYTQMRSDLSATLDCLRSGESVTVTQRGKPDLVISAKSVDEIASADEVKTSSKTIDTHLAQLIASNLSPQITEGVMKLTKQLDALLQSDEARQTMMKAANAAVALQGVSESFIKALQHTQTKHAEIIKKLEDK